MKHTIEVQTDSQLNLIFKALDIMLKLQLGQWHYAFQTVFPFGEGLELLNKESKAIYTLIQSLGEKRKSLSIHNKKLTEDARIIWDICQVLRHHTYLLKTKEEQKAEPNGRKVFKSSRTPLVNIEVTPNT